MAAAIPMLPPLSGVATSQTLDSQVTSTQTQSGDVISGQTLDVQTVDQTTATTTAVGNNITAQVVSGSLGVQSSQSMQANATASSELDVGVNAGQTALATTATGNTSEVDTLGGGALSASLQQSVGATSITASSVINAASAQAGDMTVSTEALGNTQGIGAISAPVGAAVSQTSNALTQSNSDITLQYTPGTATYAATAVSNNITATGLSGSVQSLDLSQTMTGTRTQAAQFVALGQGQEVSNAATATANNISVSNDTGALDVTTSQDNESYLRAQAESAAYSFGASSVSATGVGDSAAFGETGSQITVNNTQTNSGGVEVIASSSGTSGYDLYSSATAMGNAVTGYGCSECGGVMSISNAQTNSGVISATSGVGASGSARSATSISTAVGNSATYYIGKPGG
jgi:hypothetical protein